MRLAADRRCPAPLSARLPARIAVHALTVERVAGIEQPLDLKLAIALLALGNVALGEF